MNRLTRRKNLLLIVLVILVGVIGTVVYAAVKQKPVHSPAKSPEPTKQTDAPQQPIQTPVAFDKRKYSLTEPSSLWVIVNKQRSLPATYSPNNLQTSGGQQLRGDALVPLQQLLAEAESAGVSMKILSGYRSYATQKNLYASYVAKDGQMAADTYSARPGHSEHQTGLAVDLGTGTCDLDACFGNTQAGKWLADNAHKYGFVIRYTSDKTAITGYQYEPWHLRYVGNELASELHKSNQTMEEFFGLSAAPNY